MTSWNTETVKARIYSLALWEVLETPVYMSQSDTAISRFCSEMVVREVRDMVASGKCGFALQDVVLQRTTALNICHLYNR